jgi:chromosome partitioning protein
MIILFGGTKGGTGKSTLATNMATLLTHQGADVVLLDADPQLSSSKWVDRRNENVGLKDLPIIHCSQKTGDVMATAIDLAKRYNVVIIDAGGFDSRELRTAMVAADRMYVPIKVSQFDLETLPSLCEVIDTAKGFNANLKVFSIISQAPSNAAGTEIEETRTLLSGIEQISTCTNVIKDRKVYRDAIRDGRGIYETDNKVAIAELILLAEEIFNHEEK